MFPIEQEVTLGGIANQLVEAFANAAFELPRQEMRELLCDALSITTTQLHLNCHHRLAKTQVQKINGYLKRRLSGEPLAYIHGAVQFDNLLLFSDARALIPRPETEQLADLIKQKIGDCPIDSALDLGTGSGCLALAVKKRFPQARVVGSDSSSAALDLARSNGRKCNLDVEWKCGNWWSPHAGEIFDLIVTNPPYISEKDWSQLDAQVRNFEPKSALVSGKTGFESLEIIAAHLHLFLKPKGFFMAEIGYDQALKARSLFDKFGFETEIVFDLWGKQRYLAIESKQRTEYSYFFQSE